MKNGWKSREILLFWMMKWQCVKTLVPSEPQNSWDLWMFIPLKMLLIGIDPYPNGSHPPFLEPNDPVEEDVWWEGEHHEVPWCWDPPNPHRGPGPVAWAAMGPCFFFLVPIYGHLWWLGKMMKLEGIWWDIIINVFSVYLIQCISYILMTNPHCSQQFVGTFPSPRKGCLHRTVGRLGRRRQPHLPVCPPGERPRPGPHKREADGAKNQDLGHFYPIKIRILTKEKGDLYRFLRFERKKNQKSDCLAVSPLITSIWSLHHYDFLGQGSFFGGPEVVTSWISTRTRATPWLTTMAPLRRSPSNAKADGVMGAPCSRPWKHWGISRGFQWFKKF